MSLNVSKHIYDDAATTAVQEAIAGLLITRGDLKLVAGTKNVLVRADIEAYRNKYVTIICGGGSGHEPAHAGYIGDGMLSAAVLGNIFASPSVDSVYRAIKACASPLGVLVIVKNYTGDRLNFGMAIEKAKAEGISARMLIVGDDCTVVSSGSIAGRRGVCGTLLVQKVAGARAFHDGCTLDDVYASAESACKAVRTMGVGLSCCNLPGVEKSERLRGPQMEVGIGIHGEPGRFIQDIPSEGLATKLASIIVTTLCDDKKDATGSGNLGSSAIMVNNLGTATELELSAFVYALMPVLRAHGCSPKRIYVGSFMTALDMHGVSVTALDLSLDADLLRLLDCPSSAPAWKPSLATSNSLAPPIEDEKFVSITDTVFVECPKFSSMIYHICESLVSAEPKLTELDSRCGDGDCGFTVKAAAQSVMANLKDKVHYESTGASNLVYPVYDSIKFANTCTFLADNTSATMGGTLGAIMELLLRAMSNHYRSSGQTEVCLADALEAGISAISFYGGAKVGMRTMLDALQPAAEALRGGNLNLALEAARDGEARTATMTGLAGRSSYVNPDAIAGVEDPGAHAVKIAFEAAANFHNRHEL